MRGVSLKVPASLPDTGFIKDIEKDTGMSICHGTFFSVAVLGGFV